jgi:lysophospholipase L1-like esterase
LNTYRKIIFYVSLIVIPFVLWLSLEFILNKITHRFDPLKNDSKKGTLFLNQQYFDDFFLYELPIFNTTSTVNRAVYEKKEKLRIFTFGGSTTAGYPYNTSPDFQCPASFSNYLRAILGFNKHIPEVEILNFGCNALSSMNVLHVFKDIKKYKPDVIIIYTGHNEFFGPNEFTLSKQKVLLHHNKNFYFLFMALKRTYLYQGMRKLLRLFSRDSSKGHKDYLSWSRNNYIHPDDEINEIVRSNYKNNITTIVRQAKKTGIKVVLCTPVANWSFPPFISVHHSELNEEETAHLDSMNIHAKQLYNQGEFKAALDIWDRLKIKDPLYADYYYYSGMSYSRLQQYKKAAQELSRSRDYDAMPFRAKSFISDIIREIARRENVILADVEKFFIEVSGQQIPNITQLLDHVHPTETGYYYVALHIAKSMAENSVFSGVSQLRYPTLKDSRTVLGIGDVIVDKIEVEFPESSYFTRLAMLNPEIGRYLNFISGRANKRLAEKKREAFDEGLYKSDNEKEKDNK